MSDAALHPAVTLRLYTDHKCFGPGVAMLLRRVRKLHSLRSAAMDMDMAYSKAWTILREAVQVQKLLEKRGCSVTLYSVPRVRPLDGAVVLNCAAKHRAVFTMEEHGVTGGLGSAVAELLAERGQHPAVFHRYGVPDSFAMLTGSRDYQLDYFGLSPQKAAVDMWRRWSAGQ